MKMLLFALGPVACMGTALTYTAAQASRANLAEQYLLAAANQDRSEHHLPPVELNQNLVRAARLHALEMVRQGAISHRFPGEADLVERATNQGVQFSRISENVAEAPDASRIDAMWMASPGHRANLLDPKVDSVGIAVLRAHGEYFAVEDFARTVEAQAVERRQPRGLSCAEAQSQPNRSGRK